MTIQVVKVKLTLYHTILSFNKALENIVGKGENAGNKHFVIFPAKTTFTFINLYKDKIIKLDLVGIDFSSANAFSFLKFKILSFGKVLKFKLTT